MFDLKFALFFLSYAHITQKISLKRALQAFKHHFDRTKYGVYMSKSAREACNLLQITEKKDFSAEKRRRSQGFYAIVRNYSTKPLRSIP